MSRITRKDRKAGNPKWVPRRQAKRRNLKGLRDSNRAHYFVEPEGIQDALSRSELRRDPGDPPDSGERGTDSGRSD